MTSPQSNFTHILAYPADKPRFDRAREAMRAEMERAPIQADVTRELLTIWELLGPIRDALSAAEGHRLPMSETVRYLIDHWETT